jgi:hypothetical protein
MPRARPKPVYSTDPTAAPGDLPAGTLRPPGEEFPAEEFETVSNVPVFTEHQTTRQDGREIRFSLPELQAVCERCNQRIDDTGDYAAVTFGHTPDPSDSEAPMPDLAGFAGPFRIGTVGHPGKRQRYAILADMHFFKDEMPRVRRHPRRSPELWMEEQYEDMFLDPISLLGAEPPRLDLGLLYSARRGGRLVEKYTAVAPAAGNVSVRTDDWQAKHPTREYASRNTPPHTPEEAGPMISPDDIKQIVDAVDQLPWVAEVKQMLLAQQGPETGMPAPPVGAEAAPPVEAPPVEAPPVDAAPPVEAPPMEAPPAEAPPEAPPEEEKPAQYAADANATGEYQTADEQQEMDGTKTDITGDKAGSYDSVKLYAAMDSMADDEFEQYAAKRCGCKKYAAAEGCADGDDAHKAGEGSVEPNSPGAQASEGSVDDVSDNAAGEYQTTSEVRKLSRNRAEERHELAQLRAEVQKLDGLVEIERGARVNAERYGKLAERRHLFAFDLDEEVERTKYGKLSDEQFDSHVESIEKNYRPIPAGASLPAGFAAAPPEVTGPDAGGFSREKYSKDHSDRALRICKVRAQAGQPVAYEEVLEQLHAGQQLEE